jgi:hypothetical protein
VDCTLDALTTWGVAEPTPPLLEFDLSPGFFVELLRVELVVSELELVVLDDKV